MRIIAWQNVVSLHQAPLIRGLAGIGDFEVIWVTEKEGRRPYYHSPDIGCARLIVKPSLEQAKDLVREKESNSLHIFTTHHHPRGLPIIYRAFRQCLTAKNRMALMGEGTAWGGPRSMVRLALDVYFRRRWPDRIGFILAQGAGAVPWFTRCGYPMNKIFPFGFFVDKMESDDEPQMEKSCAEFLMVFVGQCIARKGLDLLFTVLGELKHRPWRLNIVGDGEQRYELESLSHRLGLTEKISFLGTLPNTDARRIMCKSDLLILPSKRDSWGAVVNEALMSGIPVVCSDNCGAKTLLVHPGLGEVFAYDSPATLRHILARRIQAGKRTPDLTAFIKNWSRSIQAESIAGYVAKVINWAYFNGLRPDPPWALEANRQDPRNDFSQRQMADPV